MNPDIEEAVLVNEIRNAIKTMQTNKAPSPEGFPGELIKHGFPKPYGRLINKLDRCPNVKNTLGAQRYLKENEIFPEFSIYYKINQNK